MLLVDAANVVGSRPDGWWRDRPGAARRLVERLAAAADAGRLDPPIVVVLEGRARAGVDEGTAGAVQVVHATGEGDDAMVALAAAADGDVRLVTADRALAERARAEGATVVGPRWLLERVDADG
ncbi:NYN domain-containing protein [Actinomarinicola tropica]|uniref:NTP pyrophosphohydrolase n=1 Tax=Actinomarinicola tropica TaxID=2789776 RepID=A0A5Q2RHU9_9ACTN|nr:hypothetical protein [Actinomarinicola tropica]QGG96369.1 hypothetical protein GH723_15385 [Actinomarinicola tropica]